MPLVVLLLCNKPPLLVEDEDEDNGHWKLWLGDELIRDAAGMNSGDCGVTCAGRSEEGLLITGNAGEEGAN